jgi:hypothetical protein
MNEVRARRLLTRRSDLKEGSESEFGTKRTCWRRLTMSAPEGKTDVPREPGHFRFWHL